MRAVLAGWKMCDSDQSAAASATAAAKTNDTAPSHTSQGQNDQNINGLNSMHLQQKSRRSLLTLTCETRLSQGARGHATAIYNSYSH